MKLRFFFIVVLGLLLSGCSSTWHIKKAKELCPDCFITDTTIQEIVFKLDTIIKIDTNILVFLPTDSAKIDTTIKKLKPYSFKQIYTKNGIINMKVSMTKGILKVSSHLDSAMWYHFENEILIRDALITKLTTKTSKQTVIIKEQENKLKWYQKALKWGKWILIVVVIILLLGFGYKFYKWIKK